MSGTFEIHPSANGQFHFRLKAGNGEVILSSQQYTAKASAQAGIESVRANAPEDGRYVRKTSSANQPYFVLNAANGEGLGTSQMYSSKQAMEAGIESVKANAPTAKVIEVG